MFRLMLALFGFLFTAFWRPEPQDDPTNDDPPQDDPPKDPPGKFTQEDVDRIVSERLEREKRKAERDQAEAERKAREEALKEQGKYQEIAENQATTIADKDRRISELEGKETEAEEFKARYEDLEGRYAKLLEDRLSVVPEPFQPLLETMSVVQRADWLDKNAEKLAGYTNGSRPRGSKPTGRSSGKGENPEIEEEARAAHRRGAQAAM